MKRKIAINGFGRIGRLTFRRLLQDPHADIVAINDLTDVGTLAHLLEYDSVHGRLNQEVKVVDGDIVVGTERFKVYSERNPEDLPWKTLGVHSVIECTGVFRTKEAAGKHLTAGAKKVVISAPAKGDIATVVLGVNDEILETEPDIVSNASCTTNCLAPLIKVLDENFGLEKGYITTIHSYTADQRLQDAPHTDLRRARAAAINMIPTTTGAAAAVGLVLPHLKGKLDGMAVRVPTPDGSITDLVAELKREVSVEEINAAMQKAAETNLKGILEFSDKALVSSDILGNQHSAIFDSLLTCTNGKMVKVLAWYDNEAGYAARVAQLVMKLRE